MSCNSSETTGPDETDHPLTNRWRAYPLPPGDRRGVTRVRRAVCRLANRPRGYRRWLTTPSAIPVAGPGPPSRGDSRRRRCGAGRGARRRWSKPWRWSGSSTGLSIARAVSVGATRCSPARRGRAKHADQRFWSQVRGLPDRARLGRAYRHRLISNVQRCPAGRKPGRTSRSLPARAGAIRRVAAEEPVEPDSADRFVMHRRDGDAHPGA